MLKSLTPINYNTYKGCFDIITKDRISGWILNTENPYKKVEMDIIINGQKKDTIIACEFRKDLLEAQIGISDGKYSFDIDLTKYNNYCIYINNYFEIIIDKNFSAFGEEKLILDYNNIPYLKNNDLCKIDIYTITFFSFTGEIYYSGGAERYLIDLISILQEITWDIRIIQCSSCGPWIRTFKDIKVYGVPGNYKNLLQLSKDFNTVYRKNSYCIFSPFTLAAAFCPKKSLGISHGIYWDCINNSYHDGNNSEILRSSTKHLSNIISVDNATFNFLRAICPQFIKNYKIILNYVDEKMFSFSENKIKKYTNHILEYIQKKKDKGTLIYVYPRRLYAARGLDILIDAAKSFLPISNAIILFVGRGDSYDLNKVNNLKKIFPAQVFHTWIEADQMLQAYNIADVILIPTLHSEGTSLSCIEAMYCKKCIIASNIGGLPELIINNFNGISINPTAKELFEAMIKVASNKELRESLGINAYAVAKYLTKKRWISQWKDFLYDFFDKKELQNLNINKKLNQSLSFTIYHPSVPGIEMMDMNQRPQALMMALANYGIKTIFCSQIEKSPKILHYPCDKIEIVTPNSEIFSDTTIILCYYPYTIISISDVFIKLINDDIDKKIFKSLIKKYKSLYPSPLIYSKDILIWFDYLDRYDIHPNNDERLMIKLAIKYADIVTTSAKTLEHSIKSIRGDNFYFLSNALSPEWLDESLNRIANTFLLNKYIYNNKDSNNIEIAIKWKNQGKCIGIYWGAIATWTDISFIQTKNDMFRFIIIGPISDYEDEKNIYKQNNTIHITPKKISELGPYIDLADFGIISFKLMPTTQCVNPLKFWEYLAVGLPVLSTITKEMKYQSELLGSYSQYVIRFIDNMSSISNADQKWIKESNNHSKRYYHKTFTKELNNFFSYLHNNSQKNIKAQINSDIIYENFDYSSLKKTKLIYLSKNPYFFKISYPAGFNEEIYLKWTIDIPENFEVQKVYFDILVNQEFLAQSDPFLRIFYKNNAENLEVENIYPDINGHIKLIRNYKSFFPSNILLCLSIPKLSYADKNSCYIRVIHFINAQIDIYI